MNTQCYQINMQQRFSQLLLATTESASSTLSADIISGIYNNLCIHYNQKTRQYHNLVHIRAMLDYADHHLADIQEPLAFYLAIYYHDVIYDATKVDNELQSATYFQQQISTYLPTKLITQVKSLILATAKHQLPNKEESKQTGITVTDYALFLDIDLSILAQSRTIYTAYSDAIRYEYQHVDSQTYKIGRAKVLKAFLNRDRLYFSEAFYLNHEAQARINISNEIHALLK